MARTLLAVALLAAFVMPWTLSSARQPSSQGVVEIVPDPSRARPLDHWPNDEDLKRLKSVEGKPKVVILLVLGHPSAVTYRADGEEVWDYPWLAACRVWIRKGICTGTFYTAGY